MSTAVLFGLRALSQTLTTQEALSGVFGSISLATWIFLLVCAKDGLRRAMLRIYVYVKGVLMRDRFHNLFLITRRGVLMASPLLSFLSGSLGISPTFLVSTPLFTKILDHRCTTHSVIELTIVIIWQSPWSSMLVTCIY